MVSRLFHFGSQKPGGPELAAGGGGVQMEIFQPLYAIFSLSCGTRDRGGVQILNFSVRPAGRNESAVRGKPRAALRNFVGRITMLIF